MNPAIVLVTLLCLFAAVAQADEQTSPNPLPWRSFRPAIAEQPFAKKPFVEQPDAAIEKTPLFQIDVGNLDSLDRFPRRSLLEIEATPRLEKPAPGDVLAALGETAGGLGQLARSLLYWAAEYRGLLLAAFGAFLFIKFLRREILP
ncbi:MAG: hypothetical protein RIC55_20135 [Pirellulaceae bacterium]